MSTTETSKNNGELPDMNAIGQSIKEIKRAVPVTQDSAYSYFADAMKNASYVADMINGQITDALSTLQVALNPMTLVKECVSNIEKINEAERAVKIDSINAATARGQMEKKLNDGLSSVITSFQKSSDDLSESTERLATFSQIISVRLKDATKTETASRDRIKGDLVLEQARLETLEDRYEKIKVTCDEKRGGPIDELKEIIPDKEELSSLMDVAAEDAVAGPEVAVAKKAIELAVTQINKILEIAGKVIEFTQLVEMRDAIFSALQAQQKIVKEKKASLAKVEEALDKLAIIENAAKAMETIAIEVGKIVEEFTSFVSSLQNLDDEELTADTITNLHKSMNDYLDRVRKANKKVILG